MTAIIHYHRAKNVDDAVAVLRQSRSPAVLAGGLSLVPQLRTRRRRPEMLVDINHLTELDTVTVRPEEVVVGATARQARVLAALAEHPGHQLLVAALRTMGTDLVRRRGTLMGTVAHADPALQLAAVCAVLDADVTIIGDNLHRRIAARELYANAPLNPVELGLQVSFAALGPTEGWAFQKAARRRTGAVLGGVAIRLALDERGCCLSARIAPFVCGHNGSELGDVNEWIRGRQITDQTARGAAELAARHTNTTSDVLASAEYRRHMVATLVRRALLEAAQRSVTQIEESG